MNRIYWEIGIAVIALIGIVIDLGRTKKKNVPPINFFAILTGLGCVYLAYTAFQDVFIAVLAGYIPVLLLGQRWPEWLSLDKKFGRLVFWWLADLPVVAIVFASWVYLHTGWITLMAFGAGILVHLLMTGALLKPVFPLIARQQGLVVARRLKSTEKIKSYEREVKQLELNAHMRRILAKIKRHQSLLVQAQQLIRNKEYQRAMPFLQEVIQDLSPLPKLDPQQKVLLGNAYLLRGKVQAQLKRGEDAVADIEKAKQYIRLDEEAVTILALHAVQKNDTSPKGIRVCLDLLILRKGQAENDPVQQVKRFLETICTVPGNLTVAELQAKKDTLRSLVDADVDLPAAWLGLGQVLVLLGMWSEGAEALEKARPRIPGNPALHEYLGWAYEKLGRINEARDAYEESLRLNPQQAETAHTLGLIYLDGRLKDIKPETCLEQALHWLGEAVRMKPDLVLYLYDLARACEKKGDLKTTRELVERCLRLDSQCLPAHLMLANLLFASRDFGGAVLHYRKLGAPDGWKNADLRMNAGICLVEIGSMKEGLELLAPLADSRPGVLIYTGQAHLKQAEYAQAAGDIRQYISSVGTSDLAEYCLGCAAASLNLSSQSPDYREALNYFDLVAKRNSEYAPRAHLHLAKIYQILGDPHAVVLHYQSAALPAGTQVEAGLGLARLYVSGDQLPEARAILDFLVSKYPENKQVLAHYARTAELQGDLDAALTGYERLGDFGAQGVILVRQDKTEQAILRLEKARGMGDQTDRVIYYCGLGRIHKGEFEGAIAEWALLMQRHPEDAALAMDLAQAWYLQGCKLVRAKQYSQAAEAWEHATPVFQSDPRLLRSFQQVYLLAAFGQLGKPEAIRSIERAQKSGADAQLCLYWQAVSHMLQGDLPGGAAEMKRYVSLQPVDAQAHYNLGVALLKMGQAGDAKTYLESARKIGKKTLRQQAAWALAASRAVNKEWKQVMELTAGNEPGELLPWQALLAVIALIQGGDLTQARQLAAQNKSADAHAFIGAAYTAQANIEAAMQEYRLALQLDPQQGAARQGAAFVLVSMAAEHAGNKEWKEAQACLKEARQLAPSDVAAQRLSDAVDGAAVLSGVSLENEDLAISVLEKLQKNDLQRVDVAHQLAIMNHRRAIKLECASRNGDCDRIWLRAIANWAIVLSGDVYFQRWLEGRQTLYVVPITPEEVEKLRLDVVRGRIKDVHTQFIQAYSTAGQASDATRHHRFSARLGLELSAARAMAETINLLNHRSTGKNIPVACGPLFWEQYGMTQAVGQMADEALRIDPKFQPAQVMKEALLPTGLARALLDEVQIEEAIKLLREHLASSPKDASARALIAKALVGKLQTQVNTDLEEALKTWQEAKGYGADATEAETAIFNGVMNVVSQAQSSNDYDAADRALRMAIKAMPQNRMLKDKLAELAGNHIAEKAVEKIKPLGTNLEPYRVRPILEEAKKALTEVDKLVGPNHPLIQKQLNDMKKLLAHVLNSKAVDLMNSAGTDVQRNNPAAALTKLRDARDLLNEAHINDPYDEAINQNLAAINQIFNR